MRDSEGSHASVKESELEGEDQTANVDATSSANPPLPDEPLPPLPDEKPPEEPPDDGWEPVWDSAASAFYFYNRITGLTQWENPRVPEATDAVADPADPSDPADPATASGPRPHGGYNPAIHGDYDPTASYALEAKAAEEQAAAAASAAAQGMAAGPADADYAATGQFNRFTGRWQAADINPENFGDEAKSHRQLNAFYDVDAYNHDGRSLKAERSQMKLTKAQLKAFKEKRRERKEEKRRAWLRD